MLDRAIALKKGDPSLLDERLYRHRFGEDRRRVDSFTKALVAWPNDVNACLVLPS